jgi:hypothetical protein
MKSPEMTMPEQLPNESLRAYAAFKSYCADPKRSIRRCARKLGKSSTIIARWSQRHRWQKRLRELELQDCQRAVAADEAAKLSVAEERERERLKFQQRALEASKRATERGLQILKQSAKSSKPAEAARLLAVADAIGRAALELTPSGAGSFGLHPTAAPIINIVLRRDEQSDEVKKNEREFLRKHPDYLGTRRSGNGLSV